MLSSTPLLLSWFSRKKGMQSILESHFWGLTRYRIGPRLFGLDFAGNVIFYPAYRKQSLGGWTAVTLGAPGTPSSAFLSSDTSSVNVLEDGHPLHYKASKRLQAFVAEERRIWLEKAKLEAKKKEAAAAAAAAAAASSAKAGSDPAAAPKTEGANMRVEIPSEQLRNYDSDQHFRDLLAIKCSQPRFYSSRLRISRLSTFLYKFFYFYLWAVFVSLIVQGYLMFRAWVNPPAREGLKNIEETVLHLPRLLFAGCVYGVAWLVRSAEPVIDPIVNFLNDNFPQVDWRAASAERLASKATNLADDTHPSAKERRVKEIKMQQQTELDRRTWWTRVLMVLLALFSILCVL